MLKRLTLAILIVAFPFILIQATAAGQGSGAASEDVKTRPSKQEIIDLMTRMGRMPGQQQNSKLDQTWKDPSSGNTPRSDFMFCTGLAYLGNYKAQACVGNAYDKGRGVVEDPSEAYTWYALALGNSKADKGVEQRLQEDKERVKERLVSSYPAPTDDDLDDLVKALKSRIAQYQDEVKKGKK